MVNFTPLFAAALFTGLAAARPADSAINEPAVSAPNGTPITAVLSSSTASVESATVEASSSIETTSVATSADAAATVSAASYGSGSSNWGNSGYIDCVNQCIASFGAPAAQYQPTATSGSSGSTGTGATHTVVVAPSQGVLRYIPFALNASVGDTVKFMWGANNHTVTKGSQLLPCNKSADPLTFASGLQLKDFVFTQVINDTNPLFFYCAAPTHCQKGMFGIINPPSALNNPTSVSGMMQSMVSNSSDMAAMAAYSNSKCEGTKASTWGGSINLKDMPEWSRPLVAENVMYMRTVLAANPDLMNEDGSINSAAAGANPMMIPQDIRAALNNAAATPETASSAAPAASSAVSSSAPASTSEAAKSGAISVSSPSFLVGAVVAVATFFAL
ncbi:Phytocyanin domain-containing protein [Pleurotus pulmonarius]